MAADRTVQKVFLGKTGRRRKGGRPNLKWLDSIENDLKLMDVKRWRKKAEDRFAWVMNLKGADVKLAGPCVKGFPFVYLYLTC
jgi:hypothetical protein